MERGLHCTTFLTVVISPRLGAFLGKRGYSIFPTDAVDYVSGIVNQVLTRRRQHLERRHDFIQTMIDHEEAVAHEGQSSGDSSADIKKEGSGASKKGRSLESRSIVWVTSISFNSVLSDKEIFGQALVFLAAGYETTSVLMSFLIYVLATEPDIQEKVHEEIRSVLGDVRYKCVMQHLCRMMRSCRMRSPWRSSINCVTWTW